MASTLNILTADIRYLVSLLEKGQLKSVDLLDCCLRQIEKYDSQIHAILSMPSRQTLRGIASKLDKEREFGLLRGPLHGIPVVIKVA